jgi:DNA polymerase type B, organellar and viral
VRGNRKTAPLIHPIRHNLRSGGYPRLLCFVDTETTDTTITHKEKEATLQFGYAEFWGNWNLKGYTQSQGFHFLSNAEFFDRLCNWHPYTKSCIWVVAHNMKGFDANVLDLINNMRDRGWSNTHEPMILGQNSPFLMGFRKGQYSIKFIDSTNWFSAPLAQLGETLGIPKMDDPGRTAPWLSRLPYCINDVRILREAVFAWFEFCRRNDLGTFGISQASQALNAFRHKFMSHTIIVNHEDKVAGLERRSYCGGRTECHERIGWLENMFHLDINSMYPSVMFNELYPTRLVTQGEMTVETIRAAMDKGFGVIADCKIRTDEPNYPKKSTDRLEFPTGSFSTTLTTPELRLALERGHLVSVGRCQIYHMEPIFKEFIDYFYNLRLKYKADKNEVYQYICKIFMNSLYGKFGQQSPDWEEIDWDDLPFEARDYWQNLNGNAALFEVDKVEYRRVAGQYQVRVSKHEADNASCAIAAHVTAYGRRLLLSGMETAGRGHYFYGDTDSLFVDAEGFRAISHLVDPSKLGAWKLEESNIDMNIRGPKDYDVWKDGKLLYQKIKGVRRNAVQLSENEFEQDQFITLAGSLRRGHIGSQRIMRVKKKLARVYLKGTVTPDGHIIPISYPP